MGKVQLKLAMKRKSILVAFVALLVAGIIPLLATAGSTGQNISRITNVQQSMKGAFIELHLQPVRDGVWTEIQWMDAHGEWHTVDGWQGSLIEEDQVVRWYLGEELLDAGPFRWLVYEKNAYTLSEDPTDGGKLVATNKLLATSQPFYLPEEPGRTIKMEVELPAVDDLKGVSSPALQVSQPSQADDVQYVVKAGDTLSIIARQYQSSVMAIAEANDLDNIHLIYVGQRLTIPGG